MKGRERNRRGVDGGEGVKGERCEGIERYGGHRLKLFHLGRVWRSPQEGKKKMSWY